LKNINHDQALLVCIFLFLVSLKYTFNLSFEKKYENLKKKMYDSYFCKN